MKSGHGSDTGALSASSQMPGTLEIPEEYYRESNWYQDLVSYLTSGRLPESHRSQYTHALNFRRKASRYVLAGSPARLYYRFLNGTLGQCIKESQVTATLAEAHDRHGHFSHKTVLKRLSNVWWPTRSADVQQWVATCKACAYFSPTKRSEPIRPILTFDPFDMIGLDFIGPLDLTSRGNKYILHVVDYFTRYSWAYALPHNTGPLVKQVMEKFFEEFTVPLVLYSDRGTHFVGRDIKRFWRKCGSLHIPSPASSPRSTGMVEKSNGLLEERLRTLTMAAGGNALKEWDQYLREATRALNTRDMKVHGFSPFQLLFGISPRLNLPLDNPMLAKLPGVQRILLEGPREFEERPVAAEEELRWFEGRREEWKLEAREKRVDDAVRTVEKSELRLVAKGALLEGDLVMLLDSNVRAQKGMKLHGRWNGPFVIVSRTRGSSYIIQHPHADKPFPGTHHRDTLKLYLPRPPRLGGASIVGGTGLSGIKVALRRYPKKIHKQLMGKV